MKEIHGDYGPGSDRARKMLCNGGYKTGGDVTLGKVKKIAKRAVREHESAEHEGKHAKLKLKAGGEVKGKAATERPDRRARGGATKEKVGAVNIVIGKGDDDQGQDQQKQQMAAKAGLQKGVQLGAQMAAAKMQGGAGAPPGGPMPPPGGPPPGVMAGSGGPPMPMPPPRKGGGSVPHLTAGAGSALGRLEKAEKVHVKAHERRRGGKC